jgi:hypothetical protein
MISHFVLFIYLREMYLAYHFTVWCFEIYQRMNHFIICFIDLGFITTWHALNYILFSRSDEQEREKHASFDWSTFWRIIASVRFIYLLWNRVWCCQKLFNAYVLVLGIPVPILTFNDLCCLLLMTYWHCIPFCMSFYFALCSRFTFSNTFQVFVEEKRSSLLRYYVRHLQ